MSSEFTGHLWNWENKPQDLTPVEMLVLLYLCDSADPDGGIIMNPNYDRLARFACLSVDEAIRTIGKLAGRNLVACYSNVEDQICQVADLNFPLPDEYPWPPVMAIIGGKYRRIYNERAQK